MEGRLSSYRSRYEFLQFGHDVVSPRLDLAIRRVCVLAGGQKPIPQWSEVAELCVEAHQRRREKHLLLEAF
jgi:hypothetical protein